MKLVTLMENTTCREDLCCEHGLSLYKNVPIFAVQGFCF